MNLDTSPFKQPLVLTRQMRMSLRVFEGLELGLIDLKGQPKVSRHLGDRSYTKEKTKRSV